MFGKKQLIDSRYKFLEKLNINRSDINIREGFLYCKWQAIDLAPGIDSLFC